MTLNDTINAFKEHVLAERGAARKHIKESGMSSAQQASAQNALIGPGPADSMLPYAMAAARRAIALPWKADGESGALSVTIPGGMSDTIYKALCQMVSAQLLAAKSQTSFLPDTPVAVQRKEGYSKEHGPETTLSVTAEAAPHLLALQTQVKAEAADRGV